MPEERAEEIGAFDRTMTLPRQLVSVRAGLDAALLVKVKELLIGLGETEEGREMLRGMKDSKFDALSPEAETGLSVFRELIRLVGEG